MKVVFDTNILIDYLSGVHAARKEIRSYSSPIISVISWMEVLVGARSTNEQNDLKRFLATFEIENIDEIVAERAVELRRSHKIKLPDAIIWATAKKNDCLLVSRNFRDLVKKDRSIRVPY